MSAAKVTIWNQIIGYLYWDDRNQRAIFETEESYQDSKLNVSPILHPDKRHLIDGGEFHAKFGGLMPLFNDSLPDSFGNIVFKEWLEQNCLDQSEMNPVERLLYIGKRGVGALEYEVGKEIPNVTSSIEINELAEISDKIIKRKYEQSDFLHDPEALRNILIIGSSLGGAQAKISIAIDEQGKVLAGDVLHDREVDYYIVKLEHDSDHLWFKEKNHVELVYNEMARAAGVNVAPSMLMKEGDKYHFASKRFDRERNKKTHQQTVNALSGFYGKNHEFSYSSIFEVIEYLELPYDQAEQLFKQMVFNVAAANRDDHTKNFSFLMDETGQWRYSPAYDITYPFDPYQTFQVPHQIAINGKNKDIHRSDLIAVAKHAGIRGYNPLIDQVIEETMSFKERIKSHNISSRTAQLIAKEIETNVLRLKN